MSNYFLDDEALALEHRAWLDCYSVRHRKAWDDLLANDREAAYCEAGFRRILIKNGCGVVPNEVVNDQGQSPDFRCERGGSNFYFECACIEISTIENHYGISPRLQDLPRMQVHQAQPITRLFFEKCRGKVIQCSGMGAPVLLGIGTFHSVGASESTEVDRIDELLTGEVKLSVYLDTERGGPIESAWTAMFDHSMGLRLDKEKLALEAARKCIAAVVVAYPNREVFDRVIGVLHPDGAFPFDHKLLPKVCFRMLKYNSEKGSCEPIWANDNDGLT